jgi:aspartyl-tRNA(Asn)/glutamyl-tRNA(Gln) amidotransferase subunit A
VIGRTNLDELGLGVTGINAHHGAVRNPYDPTRISGGSSSGSAVAVAGGLSLVGIGTDTGGSVRIPAALCGVVGLKPTVGALATTGVRPLAPSLDHLGILGRTVDDCETVFGALRGFSACRTLTGSFRVSVGEQLVGSGLGFAAVGHAANLLRAAGATVVVAGRLPASKDYMAVQRVIASCEAARVYRRELQGVGTPFGTIAHAYLSDGLAVTPSELRTARSARRRIRASVDAVLDACDVLVTPATDLVAPLIAEAGPGARTARTIRDGLVRYTCLFNLTGHPALVVPIGTAARLPVGVQLAAARGREATLFAVARLLCRQTGLA